MSRTERLSSLLATDDTVIKESSSSFSSRCQCRVRSLGQIHPQPGVIPQLADGLWRHERGPQQAFLGQLGQPDRIELVGLGSSREEPAASSR
jgi:hypothetical protein